MKKKRISGFSLIEAAIVLGIVGLVIGGIWVAASAVSNAKRIQDALLMLNLAQTEAAKFRKVVIEGSFEEFAPILATRSPPGGYTLVSNGDGTYKMTNGQQDFHLQIGTFGTGYALIGEIVLSRAPLGVTKAKPDLCIELSKKLLDAKLGAPEPGYHSVEWWRTASTAGTWDYGTAKPDFASVVTYCSSPALETRTIRFLWYL